MLRLWLRLCAVLACVVSAVLEVDLHAGDVMTMEGRTQKHCLHCVPRALPW